MRTWAKAALMLPIAGVAAGWLVSKSVTPRYVVTARLALGDSLSPSFRAREYLGRIEKDVLNLGGFSAAMRRNVTIEAESATGSYVAFRLSFASPDPVQTQMTVGRLIELFARSNGYLGMGPSQTKRRNHDGRIEKLEARLMALEKRLGIPDEPAPRVAASPGTRRIPIFDGTRLRDIEQTSEPGGVTPTPGVASGGPQFEVIDPPGAAVKVYPSAVRFMAAGLAAGSLSAGIVLMFGRGRAMAGAA